MMEDACGGVRHEGRMDGYDEVIKSNNIINFKYNHPPTFAVDLNLN